MKIAKKILRILGKVFDFISENIDVVALFMWIMYLPHTVVLRYNHSLIFDYNEIHLILIGIYTYTYLYRLIKSKFDFRIYDFIVFGLLILTLLSTLNALDVDMAIWGASRKNGFITLLSYGLMFLSFMRINNKKKMVFLSSAILAIGVLNVYYARYQLFTDIEGFYRFYKPYMANGLCINPNFLGSFMALLLPFTISLFVTCEMKSKLSTVVLSILYFVLSFIFLAGLIFAQSTGPLVGVILALLFFLIIILIWKRKYLLKYLLIVSVLCVAFVGIEQKSRDYYEKMEYEIDERYTILGGMQDIYEFIGKHLFGMKFEIKEDAGNGRLWIWETSLPLLKERPLLGYGTDNFRLAFPQTKFFIIYAEAHNVYLNYAVNNGIPAAVIFVLALLYIVWEAIRTKDKTVWAYCIAYVSFCIQAFFSISVIWVSTYFYLFTAFLVALIIMHKKSKKYDVVLYGYYGYQNKGDDYVLNRTINNLLSLNNDLKICVLVGKRYPKSDKIKNVVYKRRSIFNTLKYFRITNYVIIGGGNLLQDKTSNKSFYYYMFVLRLAKYLKKDIIFYGNGIGPLSQKNLNKLRKAKLPVKLALMREEASFNLAKEIYPNAVVKLTTDELFTYKMDITKTNNKKDYVCFCYKEEDINKIKNLAEYVDRYCLENNKNIEIIIMDQNRDGKIINEVVSSLKSKYNVHIFTDLDKMLNLISNASMVVSMRLHLLILASMCGIKPIAITSDDLKLNEFMKRIDAEDMIFDINDNNYDKLGKLFVNKGKVDVSHLVELANENAREVINLMEGMNE